MTPLLCMLSACVSQPSSPAHAHPDENLLGFIDGERVTRSEVVAHLGKPCATFEHDQVIAYRVGKAAGGYYVVSLPQKPSELDWQAVDYDLMLRFDDQGSLQ